MGVTQFIGKHLAKFRDVAANCRRHPTIIGAFDRRDAPSSVASSCWFARARSVMRLMTAYFMACLSAVAGTNHDAVKEYCTSLKMLGKGMTSARLDYFTHYRGSAGKLADARYVHGERVCRLGISSA